MEYIPDTPEAIIFESMLEGYAEYYSAELSQKVRRGMNETRQKGNFTGGYLIYGYKVVNKKILIDEEQAEVVKFIYEQYSAGVYVKNIIKTLTAKGIFNKGKPFARNTIYNILKNEKYSGIYRHGNEVFDNMYPQIVSTEIYDKVRAKIDKNRYGKRSVAVVYLLRNKIKCGYCGQQINAECGTAKNGEIKRYYKCLGRKHQSGCKKSQVRKEILENFVIENVVSELSKENTMYKIVNGSLKIQNEQITANSALSNLLREQRQTETAINNIMNAIEQGGTTNTAMKRLCELEQKQEDLEKSIVVEKAKTAFRLSETEIREFYRQALALEPQMLINYLVKGNYAI